MITFAIISHFRLGLGNEMHIKILHSLVQSVTICWHEVTGSTGTTLSLTLSVVFLILHTNHMVGSDVTGVMLLLLRLLHIGFNITHHDQTCCRSSLITLH